MCYHYHYFRRILAVFKALTDEINVVEEYLEEIEGTEEVVVVVVLRHLPSAPSSECNNPTLILEEQVMTHHI